MWQRFTERARRTIFYAQEEAARLGEHFVATEHLLLGLLRENDHVAARILLQENVSLEALRMDIEQQAARGDGKIAGIDLQLTPRCKRVIDLAYDEARMLNNNYIGTEHLLLGLVREAEGLAGRVLTKHGAALDQVRNAVRTLQQQSSAQQTVGQGGAQSTGSGTEPIKGDMGTLQNPEGRGGSEWVEVALTEEALGEITETLLLKDPYAYRELLAGGTVLRIPAGTEAKLLRRAPQNLSHYSVRLFGSKHEGKAVWVQHDQFRRTGPDDHPFPPELPDS
jgi:ATP-dependent Clp protease ATP-binding subunit ClpC